MIFPNIAEYEDKDSELAKYTISLLHNKIDELQQKLDDINFYIKQKYKERISEDQKIDLRNIELISSGIIKVVRDD